MLGRPSTRLRSLRAFDSGESWRAMSEGAKRPSRMAGSTGLEPAASGVTGRRSNQLNYDPKLWSA